MHIPYRGDAPVLTALLAGDVQPFVRHPDTAVRVHVLQLAERWLAATKSRGSLRSFAI